MQKENEEVVDQEGKDEEQEESGEVPGMARSQKTKGKSHSLAEGSVSGSQPLA